MVNDLLNLQPFLLSRAMYLTRNPFDAKDLMQETFFKAIKNKDSFKLGTNLKSWLSTILRNTYINGYRKQRRQNLIGLKNEFGSPEKLKIGNEAEYNFLKTELDTIIKTQSLIDQDLIKYLKEGYSYKEMAELLELPIGTVKSKIHLLRKRIMMKYETLNTVKIN